MPKRKSNSVSNFNLQKYFIISAILLSLVALGITVFASQQKTTSTSEAAWTGSSNSRCYKNPSIIYESSKGYPNYVIYNMRLKNNDAEINGCLATRDFFVISDVPTGWTGKIININGTAVTRLVNIGPQRSKKFKLYVNPAKNAKNGKYLVGIKARAVLNPSLSNSIYLNYFKD